MIGKQASPIGEIQISKWIDNADIFKGKSGVGGS
jgi:hypothetical protein